MAEATDPVTPAEVKSNSETPPATPSDLWAAVLQRVEEFLDRTSKAGGKFRRVTEARKFVAWLNTQGLTPEWVAENSVETLKRWDKHVGVPETGKLTINQGMAKAAAKIVLTEEDNMRNNRPLPPKQVAQPPPPEDEAEDEGEFEDEDETEETEADVVPPSQRKQQRAAAPQQQVQMAPPPPQMYAAPPPGYYPPPYGYPPPPKGKVGRPSSNPNSLTYRPPGAPVPGGSLSRLISPQMREKVRVYRRIAGGKREFLNDYTVQEIDGSLEKFIHEFVDPDFGDGNQQENTYDVFEVGPDGKDRGQPVSITVLNREVQQNTNPNDPLAQARSALELLQDVRAIDSERHEQSQALLDEFKKKAVNGGDMNSMMMLMMMERFMGGNGGSSGTEGVVLKVLEKLNANGGSPVVIPAAPPPAGPSALDKVVEALLANSLKPPPQPKTIIEQMGELKMMMEILKPAQQSPVPPELVSLLAKMNEKLDKPRGGVEEALSHFERIRGMVKELAPQVNAGGITGAIQSIITPELGTALGRVVAQGINKAQEMAQGAAGAPGTPGAPAQRPIQHAQPAQPVQATQNPQPQGIPPEVEKAIRAFQGEKDEMKAREALVVMLFTMYQTMPQQQARLDPVLQAVLNGDFNPARQALKEILLASQRPELVTDVFIDRTIAALITNAGGTPPKELLHEAKVVQLAPPAPAQAAVPSVPYDIPTAAESEAKEKAERETKKNGTNGASAEPAAVPVTKFEKKEAVAQPSNIA